MKQMPLSELLPQEGIDIINQFHTDLVNGRYEGIEYLDVHSIMRERLKPYKDYYTARGVIDEDYFVLTVLQALGQ